MSSLLHVRWFQLYWKNTDMPMCFIGFHHYSDTAKLPPIRYTESSHESYKGKTSLLSPFATFNHQELLGCLLLSHFNLSVNSRVNLHIVYQAKFKHTVLTRRRTGMPSRQGANGKEVLKHLFSKRKCFLYMHFALPCL